MWANASHKAHVNRFSVNINSNLDERGNIVAIQYYWGFNVSYRKFGGQCNLGERLGWEIIINLL